MYSDEGSVLQKGFDSMRYRAVFFLLPVWLVVGTLSMRADAQAGHRLSVREAESQVAGWVKAHKPHDGSAWHSRPQLKEITPKELWDRAGAQVFKLRDDTHSFDEADAYLIQGKYILPLSIGFGGSGLDSLCVCDLNHDSRLELVYTYSYGSGVNGSSLGIVRLNAAGPVPLATQLTTTQGPLQVEKQNDQTIKVSARGTLLGSLVLTHKGNTDVPDVQFAPGVPQTWRKDLGHVKRKR